MTILSCSVFDGDGPEEKEPCIFCEWGSFAIDSEPAWSPDGNTIAYVGADTVGELGIYLINPDGTDKHLFHSGNVGSPSWSPDNNWLVFHENAQIYKKHLVTDSLVQLTVEGRNFFPAWSPDGERIAYDRSIEDETGPGGIWIMKQDGEKKESIFGGAFPDWHTNGEQIIGTIGTSSTSVWKRFKIYTIYDGSTEILDAVVDASNLYPKYSPDGRRLLFTSQPYASQMNIYLMDLNDKSIRQLTHEGGYSNDWSPDGAWIVYTETSETGRLWIMKPDGSEKKQLTYED
jgi:Tol biopolymer transport system component